MFGPKKVSLFFDGLYLIGFIVAQMWGPVTYLIISFFPSMILEWCVYPFAGYLDMPHVPFDKWIIEADENYK